jgi:hypothetical protein
MATFTSRSHAGPRALRPAWAYGLAAAIIGLALFCVGHPVAALRDLPGLMGPLADRAYARIRDLRVRRAGDAPARRHDLRSGRAAPGATGCAWNADGRDRLVHAGQLGDLAVRGARGARAGDRSPAGGRQCRAARPHPSRDAGAVGLTNGVASTAGLGLGVLTSAIIIDLLPAPRVAPYGVLLLLFAAAFVGATKMPEPVAERSRAS